MTKLHNCEKWSKSGKRWLITQPLIKSPWNLPPLDVMDAKSLKVYMIESDEQFSL